MTFDKKLLDGYRSLVQNTSIIQLYKEVIKLITYVNKSLSDEYPHFKFTSTQENKMDYFYFQFYDETLKSKGLKFVVVFLNKECRFELWLSGFNKTIQKKYFEKFNQIEGLTHYPSKTDYLIKREISNIDLSDADELIESIKLEVNYLIDKIN